MAENGSTTQRVGFAGLGAMGFGMATNMVRNGIDVIAFDLNPVALQKLAAEGGTVASSLQDASEGCSKFFVMVATPSQVDSLVFESGENSLWKSLAHGAILCLFSTLPPDYVIGLKKRLEEAGRQDIQLLDAPVSGGAIGAQKGTLSIMIGGDQAALSAVETELAAVSAPGRVFHCGAIGAASMLKMLNQHLAGTHIVAAAEILAFATSCGLSPQETYKVIQSSAASSWIFGDRGISMLEANWTPRSAVTIFTKDLSIVNEAADSANHPCPLASVSYQAFLERVARGGGRDDDASVVCNYENVIGKRVCEEVEEEKAPPTPPMEDLPEVKSIHSAIFVSKKSPSEMMSPISSSTFRAILESNSFQLSGPLVLLWDCSTVEDKENMVACLNNLSDGSIVIALGMGDVAEVETTLGPLSLMFPGLRFTDGHFISSNSSSNSQLIFSAYDSAFTSSIKAVLPPDMTVHSFTGKLGAASNMRLAISLGALIHVAAAAECYSLALAKGVSTQLVYNLIAGAAGSSHQFNERFLDMIARDFEAKPGADRISIQRASEDLVRLQAICAKMNFPARLLAATHQVFKAVSKKVTSENTSVAAIVQYWEP